MGNRTPSEDGFALEPMGFWFLQKKVRFPEEAGGEETRMNRSRRREGENVEGVPPWTMVKKERKKKKMARKSTAFAIK